MRSGFVDEGNFFKIRKNNDLGVGGAFNLRLSYRAEIDQILVAAKRRTRLGIYDTIEDLTISDTLLTLNDVESLEDSWDMEY